MHEGEGNCIKYLKRGWNRTESRGHKDLKKGGTRWVKGWVPKKGGKVGTTLRTMDDLILPILFILN